MPGTTRRAILKILAAAPAGAPMPALRAQSATTPELRIGALFPAAGPWAGIGEESFRGVELAVDARNARGGVFGRPVRLLRARADHPAQAAEAARLLMSVERAMALFGTASSALSMTATQVAELQGVPFFELGAMADAVTGRGYRLVFRSAPRAIDYAAATLRACHAVLPALWNAQVSTIKVSVLHDLGPEGQSIGLALDTMLRQGTGPRVLPRLSYPAAMLPGQPGNPPPPQDFPALLQRLREAGPDVLLHIGQPEDVAALFSAMRDAGWSPRMVIGCGAGYSSRDTAQAIGQGFEGVMAVDTPPYATGGDLALSAQQLAQRYAARYGHAPRSGQSLSNAMGASFFLEALHRAGSPEQERIRSAVLAMRAGDAPAGWPTDLDASGQNLLACPLLSQWQRQDDELRQLAVEGPAAVAAPRARMGPLSSP
jgi:branched-chain amino acid transport system substrate-binding protein